MIMRKQTFILTLAGLVMAAPWLTGCQSKGNHEKWVDDANNRWHETRSALMVDMARQQFETGDLERAQKSVREGLEIDPDHAQLQLLAGRIAMERGQLERSYHLFDRAVEADEELAEGHYYRGLVLQRWQKYKQARDAYKKAYDIKPDEVDYLLAMSEMDVQLGKVDAAIELLESKRVYFDQNSTLRAALGHLYNMQERYAKAATLFQEAALLDPSNERLTEELGLAQLAAGQAEQALKTLQGLLAKHPNKKRADLRRALARAYVQTGRMQQAHQTYLQLARSEAGGARDWLRLGELAWDQGEVGTALDAAHRVIDEAPNNHRGYMLAGLALKKRDNLEQALRMFDQAAERAPDQADPLILRGLALQQAGRNDAAAQAYRNALERAPEDQRAKRLLKTVDRAHS
jgi:tetratricopeptide (TPR) repeat protein